MAERRSSAGSRARPDTERAADAGAQAGPTPAPVIEYLAHLRVERRMSPHTLAGYRRELDALSAGTAHAGVDIEAPAEADIRAFVASEHRRGLSPKSLQRRLSAVRGFYQWRL